MTDTPGVRDFPFIVDKDSIWQIVDELVWREQAEGKAGLERRLRLSELFELEERLHGRTSFIPKRRN